MMLFAGLNALAGLGGGAPQVVILINVFNVLPKDATIMVFACVFGGSFGNMVNQMRRAYDGVPVVNYGYASVTIPVMFIGSILGVLLNKWLPSVATVLFIMYLNGVTLPKMYRRFKR